MEEYSEKALGLRYTKENNGYSSAERQYTEGLYRSVARYKVKKNYKRKRRKGM
jgi:hypothetical protein